MRPGEGLDQGGLAGAVATDQGDHLAGVEVNGDIIDGVNATEGDAHVSQLDQRGPICHCVAHVVTLFL